LCATGKPGGYTLSDSTGNEKKKSPEKKAKPASVKKTAKAKKSGKEKSGKIILVESPTKVNTIKKFVAGKYKVLATKGHIFDLPKTKLGVDVEHDFTPTYIVMKDKKKILKEIKEETKNAAEIYLATDPDREGEAICWHVANEIQRVQKDPGSQKIVRVTFNEITKTAVLKALDNPREININLVNAQQARRVLDRLVGYRLSPLLWKVLRKGLSAGRVQSVALKLIVDRQAEIDAFNPVEYWSVKGLFEKINAGKFEAKLTEKNGEKIDLKAEPDSAAVVAELKNQQYTVSDVIKKERRRKQYPPFITSTLQQDAARRFRFTAQKTMMLAQQLYEGIDIKGEGHVGLITYMRTDSLRVAAEAQQEAMKYIGENLGPEYVPAEPNVYKSKKSSQDAHEAIRPSSAYRNLGAVKDSLDPDQFKIYSIIWKRFMASQSVPAVFDDTRVKISAGPYTLQANGSVKKFDGFMKLYDEEPKEQENGEQDADDGSQEQALLPELNTGDSLSLLELKPEQHFTQPPPYFTDASLVKALEEKDIGRPSTYAPIISTLVYRKYVDRDRGKFMPTELGTLVSGILSKNFPTIINEEFTAKMEGDLDRVEEGSVEWKTLLKDFFSNLSELIAAAEPHMDEMKRELEGNIEEKCEKCGSRMIIKWGRFGKFLSCEKYPECKNAKPMEGMEREQEKIEGSCPDCGSALLLKRGPYGAFIACSRYPECKYTKQHIIKAGVPCPDCGGDIIERTFKMTRKFYGCSNYPKCKFMVWDKPIDEKCPKCGAPFLLEKWRKNNVTVYCRQCDYKYDKETVSNE